MNKIRIAIMLIVCMAMPGSAQYANYLDMLKDQLRMLTADMPAKSRATAWQVTEVTEYVTVYESADRRMFFIAVNKDYGHHMDNAILAYSTEAGFRGMESQWKKNLLDDYGKQVAQAFGNLSSSASSKGKSAASNAALFTLSPSSAADRHIKPMLATKWGQDHPYNNFCPIIIPPATHSLTGCMATAMSQLMYYHAYPSTGKGSYHGGDKQGEYTVDFARMNVDWQNMQRDYSVAYNHDDGAAPVASLMAANARAVASRFMMGSTVADAQAARAVLVNHWNYSPQCKFIQSSDTRLLLQTINDNLVSGMPVIACGGNHAFICDGYRQGGYYHLNLGWRGAANGYYKILLSARTTNRPHVASHIIEEVICDILPLRGNSALAKTVDVKTPGTLSSLLSQSEKRQTASLTVTGRINGKDIALLRRMMGAPDGWKQEAAYGDRQRWTGVLRHLNLSGARLVEDRSALFLRVMTNKGRFTWRGQTYDISNGDKAEYASFLKTEVSRGEGYRYATYRGMPCVELLVVENSISPMMFFDCQNLTTLQLPKRTKTILGNAFQRCGSMQTIALPASVRQIEAGAFSECHLLREVVCQSLPTETCHNLFPFKAAGRYGEYDGLVHKGLFSGNNKYTCRGLVRNGKVVGKINYKVVW